jgi:hypothetical protein
LASWFLWQFRYDRLFFRINAIAEHPFEFTLLDPGVGEAGCWVVAHHDGALFAAKAVCVSKTFCASWCDFQKQSVTVAFADTFLAWFECPDFFIGERHGWFFCPTTEALQERKKNRALGTC